MPSASPPLAVPPCTLGATGNPAHQTEETAGNDRDTPSVGEEADASEAGSSYSTSIADNSSSSGSSLSSEEDLLCYDDSDEVAAGILEDFTEGVDSWLEDVHGVGREAFFGLFKRDATPHFCRPSLGVIGRHVSTAVCAAIFRL